ncbi:MAG: (Fe-S)-binding protein [Bacteroidota bacterium]|nr:(Fe-S)-binding protein [Bacteroidota bacterium]
MTKQIYFIIVLLITIGIFSFSIYRYYRFFKLTKPFPINNWGKRIIIFIKLVIGQSKIFRFPLIGLAHALVFWGFCFILFGSMEMIIDGIIGTERILSFLGVVYSFIIAAGDVFAFVVGIAIIIFLFRRIFMKIKRFSGEEMKKVSHYDANIALTLILLLMISLLGINTFYCLGNQHEIQGIYPVSILLIPLFDGMQASSIHFWYEFNWWLHILLIFIFANVLPYSKHFHVFMSAPNVLLSRIDPLGFIYNMESISKEVKLMMNPDTAFDEQEEEGEVERFGVLDTTDVTWKTYLDSLTCTQCGRCTSVCPANLTGKKLSPRKLMIDLRARMKEKGLGIIKNGKDFNDNKSLIRDYISEEEIWACTTCNACAQECPININHPSLILDMRRYLVMEESKSAKGINPVFSNIENNGAPWQYSPEDRMLWAEGLEVPLMSDLMAKNKKPEFLFWVGSAGAYDDRNKKVTRSFIKILNHLNINYAVLGVEESDSGDIARRTGNEMLFQMQAFMNIEILKNYDVTKIITCDPHDFNTLKNEYPDFGGSYEVIHHSQFLQKIIKEGKVNINSDALKDKRIVYHDPCYLGRANNEYQAARDVLNVIPSTKVEMDKNKSFAMCCGGGGGQMFKEAETGDKEIYMERTEQALEKSPDIIATSCPFCMVMFTDGLKYKNKEEEIKNYDIAELLEISMGI